VRQRCIPKPKPRKNKIGDAKQNTACLCSHQSTVKVTIRGCTVRHKPTIIVVQKGEKRIEKKESIKKEKSELKTKGEKTRMSSCTPIGRECRVFILVE